MRTYTFAAVLAIAAAACSKPPPAAKVEEKVPPKRLLAAAGTTLTPLTFGIAAPLGAAAGVETGPVAGAYLSKVLPANVDVRLFSYDQLADDLAEGKLDFAYLPPLVYVKALKREPRLKLLRKALHRGQATYESVIFVRADSPYMKIADLKGKKIAWVQKGSTSGNLVPRAYLKGQSLEPSTFFSDERFLADHGKVCEAVFGKDVDAGASFADFPPRDGVVLVDGCASALKDGVKDLRIIYASDPIPNDVIVVSPRAPDNLAERLGQELDKMVTTEEGKAALSAGFKSEGFFAVKDDEFAAVRQVLAVFPDGDELAGGAKAAPPVAPAAPVPAAPVPAAPVPAPAATADKK